MVPELGRHNTAKTQTIEAAKSAARAFTLDTLAVGLDLFHVEIPGPLEALLAEEFAHKGRRIDKETIRQWGLEHVLGPLRNRLWQHAFSRLPKQVFVAQGTTKLPARISKTSSSSNARPRCAGRSTSMSWVPKE